MPRTLRRELVENRRVSWLSSIFSSYYSAASLGLPEDLATREFAYQPINSTTYIRHLSFKNPGSVREYFSKNPPLHLYYSSARYAYPEIPDMEQKVWLGSNLIFDIDADHLSTCKYMEQLHVCLSCGYKMRGSSIKKCPRCGSNNVVEAEPIPGKCIVKAASTAKRLVRALRKEFGFNKTRIYYSGNRGFHVLPECNDECMKMTSEERREMIDYLKGVGLSVNDAVFMNYTRKSPVLIAPNPRDPGWRGRIGEELYRMIKLQPHKLLTIRELKNKYGIKDFQKLMENELIMNSRIEVDEKVTIDIHRLIRIPGSLNGKTGFPVIRIEESKLDNFKITSEISPLKGKTTVKLRVSLNNQILGYRINAGKNDVVTLPQSIALFMILKNIATPL